ncbi:hypothetical protein P167DRAFT_295743 [Morchella conica CCBAS932]|uniref:Uncharacterized protein n=1 Tax=Morchella conica CCBAS932 TaxID=1392247 RepID=A0A3N4KMQ0_9PEZI|nr:hypothetical protein P167DRAFT_295743 [Morchella conica CCBAS932]
MFGTDNGYYLRAAVSNRRNDFGSHFAIACHVASGLTAPNLNPDPAKIATSFVWRCGGVAVWRCGGVAVWWCPVIQNYGHGAISCLSTYDTLLAYSPVGPEG